MISKIVLKEVASYRKEAVLETDKKVNLIYGLNGTGVKSIFVCKLPSGITVDNYAARRAACSSAIRCS